ADTLPPSRLATGQIGRNERMRIYEIDHSVFRAIKFARRDRLNPVRAESIDDLVPGSRHVVGLLQHTTVPHQLDLRTHELRAKSWGCWVDDGLDLIEDTRAGAIAGVPR